MTEISTTKKVPPARKKPLTQRGRETLLPHHETPATLPERAEPWRLFVVDDEDEFLVGLQTFASLEHPGRFDLRTHQPKDKNGTLIELRNLIATGWIPEAILLDVNLAEGGAGGHAYLKQLQEDQELLRFPVALMTKATYTEDEDKVRSTQTEPEAILYQKSPDGLFLAKVAESLEVWKRHARRRCWLRLLTHLAGWSTDKSLSTHTVYEKTLAYCRAQFGVDYASIHEVLFAGETDYEASYLDHGSRPVFKDDALKLQVVDQSEPSWPSNHHAAMDTALINQVPILDTTVRSKRPVYRQKLSARELGELKSRFLDRAYLGVRLFDSRPIGTLTLVGAKDNGFDQYDANYLQAVAAILSSKVGRDKADTVFQKATLDFASAVSKATSAEAVAEVLAQTLHPLVHIATSQQRQKENFKTTVRLIDKSGERLVRVAHLGYPSDGTPIKLNESKSVYVSVVKGNQARKNLRKREPEYKATDKESLAFMCVPIGSGSRVYGAINFERRAELDYEQRMVARVEAFAAIAAQRMWILENESTLKTLIGWATEYTANNDFETTWRHCLEALSRHLRANCLLLVVPGVLASDPWIVKRIFYLNKPEKAIDDPKKWSEFFARTWSQSSLASWGKRPSAYEFTNNPADFVNTSELIGGQSQAADAIIDLSDRNKTRQGALLALWFLSPNTVHIGGRELPISPELVAFTADLLRREARALRRSDDDVSRERLAQIGAATSLIYHILNNVIGGVGNRLNSALDALQVGEMTEVDFSIRGAQAELFRLPDLNTAFAFVAEPKPGPVSTRDLASLWGRVAGKLGSKAQRCLANIKLCMEVQTQPAASADTDRALVELSMYIVVDNALDALSENKPGSTREVGAKLDVADQSIVIAIWDNGPGVSDQFIERLFQYQATTKSTGQGMGLYLIRKHLRSIGGDLTYRVGTNGGAIFEIHLKRIGAGE